MNKQEVIALFADDVAARKQLISEYLKSDAPYEDRLEVLRTTPEHLKTIDPWIVHFSVNGEEISWYDGFYVERGSIHEFGEEQDYGAGEDWTPEEAREFYEQAMTKGIHGFRMDW